MIDAVDAKKILDRSLQPKREEVKRHAMLLSRKIKIAAKLKQDNCRYEVLGDMMSVEQVSAIAIMVAFEMKNRGYKVKIRDNEIHVSWKKIK